MKTTIKTLINSVKKALANKASFPAFEKAYVNGNGDIIARSMPDNNTDIFVFIAGIVEEISARNKVYDKNALSLAADTGLFKGGQEMPENFADVYDIPTGDYNKVCEISADDLKAAAITTSKDGSRPVLTAIHITSDGIIESVDGFRAYRKPGIAVNYDALNDYEKNDGFLIAAAAAAYSFKGMISIYNSEKYLRLEDSSGLTLYVRKFDKELKYFNLGNIYKDNIKLSGSAKIKNVKEFAPVLKTAAANKDRRTNMLFLRLRAGVIDYYIKGLEIFGSVEADTDIFNYDFYVALNPRFLYDAIINQDCNFIEFESRNAPVYISGSDGKKALVLPIRDDGINPFEEHDRIEAEKEREKEREALARLNARQHEENKFVNISEDDVKKEIEASESAVAETPAESAVAADLETSTDNKPEIMPAENHETPAESADLEKLEIVPAEIIKARAIYQRLVKSGFIPTKLQVIEADYIYQENRSLLEPIARKTGSMYLDTNSIIAAIMTVFDN